MWALRGVVWGVRAARAGWGANAATQVAERVVIQAGERQLQLGIHALERLAQRGISQAQVQAVVRKANPFTYIHDGVMKTGYYDPVSKIFVGEVEGTITTVFKTSARYIENLIKTAR